MTYRPWENCDPIERLKQDWQVENGTILDGGRTSWVYDIQAQTFQARRFRPRA